MVVNNCYRSGTFIAPHTHHYWRRDRPATTTTVPFQVTTTCTHQIIDYAITGSYSLNHHTSRLDTETEDDGIDRMDLEEEEEEKEDDTGRMDLDVPSASGSVAHQQLGGDMVHTYTLFVHRKALSRCEIHERECVKR